MCEKFDVSAEERRNWLIGKGCAGVANAANTIMSVGRSVGRNFEPLDDNGRTTKNFHDDFDQATREYLAAKIATIEADLKALVERMRELYLVECNYDDTNVTRAIIECENLILSLYYNSLSSNFDIEPIWRGHLPDKLKRLGGGVRH